MSPLDDIKEFKTTLFSTPKTRRSAIKSISTGMTIAALSGCIKIRKPKQKIITYTNEPEDLIPGIPNYYATSFELNSQVNAIIATSHEGRPTKLDGHPNFPLNKGASSSFLQAEIQQLYDPDQIKQPYNQNKKLTVKDVNQYLNNLNFKEKTIIVLPKTYSILNQKLLSDLSKKNVDIFYINPVNENKRQHAIKSLFGSNGYIKYNFKKTKLILNFNDDFLGISSPSISTISDYVDSQNKFNNITFSNSLTITDSKADSIINNSIKQQEKNIIYISKQIISKFGSEKEKATVNKFQLNSNEIDSQLLDKVIKKLVDNKSKSIITIGESHSKSIQALGLLLNKALNNIGNTVNIMHERAFKSDFITDSDFEASIKKINELLNKQQVKRVISLEIDLTRFIDSFKEKSKSIDLIYLSRYEDAQTKIANLVIPASHFLESWNLFLTKESLIVIQQPLIEKLYKSFSVTDILLNINNKNRSPYQYLKDMTNQLRLNLKDLKKSGFINKRNKKLTIINNTIKPQETTKKGLHLNVIPSYQLNDGKYSNNAWLNETPDPISKLTWGNAFYVSSAFAKKYNLTNGNIIKMEVNEESITGPILILPGQNDQTVTLSFGHGKINNGSFSGYGINADKFEPNNLYIINKIKNTGENSVLADSQMNHGLDEEQLAASGIENRIKKILQIKTEDEINHPHDKKHKIHSLYKEQEYKGKFQWGMSIDLNSCLGCSACAVSCQAENNIPVVGREQVIIGREMSWLRIDRYFIENTNKETTLNFMPVACVHCENAPCEQVCPVNATVHDDEGLNVMTYNRCIGTRYCANNCPYKVRRFNFFDWHQKNPQSVKKDRIHIFDYFREPSKTTQMQFNPEVTVRMRGVMEKCTYCLQRITNAKIKATTTNSNEPIDNLQTACQQACATNSITFGDISNKKSKVSKIRKSKRRYDLLQYELNTKPRTIYLAKIERPIWSKKENSHGHH